MQFVNENACIFIKWKHVPRYWPFVRGIHLSPVNSSHKGQWRGTLMFSLIRAWINRWVNHREAGDLILHRAHYDVIVIKSSQKCVTKGPVHNALSLLISYRSSPNIAQTITWTNVNGIKSTSHRWLNAILQYRLCVCNEDTTVLHQAINMAIDMASLGHRLCGIKGGVKYVILQHL